MSSKLKPTIDRLAHALANFGYHPKRADLIEIGARAFGCRSSNLLTAAANADRLAEINAPVAPKMLHIVTVTHNNPREIITLSGWSHAEAKHAFADHIRISEKNLFEGVPETDLADDNYVAKRFAAHNGDFSFDTIDVPPLPDSQQLLPTATQPKTPLAIRIGELSYAGQELTIFKDPRTERFFAAKDGDESGLAPDSGLVRLQKRHGDRPVIRPFLDISTCHISEATGRWLDEQGVIAAHCRDHTDEQPIINIGSTMYGWLLHAGSEESASTPDSKIPDDLLVVMAYARKNKADYILFDGDASECDDLPRFNWNEKAIPESYLPALKDETHDNNLVAKIQADLGQKRSAIAKSEFDAYDFGDENIISDVTGWEYISPGVEMTRRIYLCATDEKQGDATAHKKGQTTTAAHFIVTFSSTTSDQIIDAYAIDHSGNIFGTRGKS